MWRCATWQPAAQDWHPRFSARRRHYRYTVLNQALRSPLDRRYAHHVTAAAGSGGLQAASEMLVGEHDFASFGQPTQGESTVRSIFSAHWQQDGACFAFDVVGNAFLRGMVRSLVGSLLQVGTGAWPVERIGEVSGGPGSGPGGAPAPACGLCLMSVEYCIREQ